jgi:glucose-1-phosphate thymidylyltransferase
MKGLVLAAGMGTRLRPLTGQVSKAMLPLAGAPLIAYPIRALLDAGIRDIGIVGGENLAALQTGLAGHFADSANPPELTYLCQTEQKGLAHAVDCARDYCGGGDIVLLFCDNLFAAPLAPALQEWRALKHSRLGYEALVHTITVDDPRAFGVAVLDADRSVQNLEEKPTQPRSDQAVIGIDILTPCIFDAIARIAPSARGEYEITDALMELVRMGHRVHARELPGWWFDTGTFAALLDVLPPVLDELALTAHERIWVHSDAHVKNCEFEAPVYIGPGCKVSGSRLGPYVSLESDCTVRGCELTHCIAYPGTNSEGERHTHAILWEGGQCYPKEQGAQH